MALTDWTAKVFTADLSQQLDIPLVSMSGVVRHLAGGEWTVEVSESVWDVIAAYWPKVDQPRLGFAVQVPGAVVISGGITQAKRSRQSGTRTMELSGEDEFAALGTRLVWPTPSSLPPWNTDGYWTVTAQASSAIAEMVRRNAGDLARTERRQPGLTVIDGGDGLSGVWQYRLTNLGTAVADIASQGGQSVLVTRRLDGGLDVLIQPAADRTEVHLDEDSLGDYELVLAAPTATTIIAGGSGELTSRLFSIAGQDVVGTARIEAFSDQRSLTTQPQLDRSAAATRAASSGTTTFAGSLTTEMSDRVLWRRDYSLGDTITLQIGSQQWAAQVTGVNISIDGTGLHLSPILGTAPRHALAQLLRDVSNLSDRLDNIEVA